MQYPNQLTVMIFCNYYTGQLFGIVFGFPHSRILLLTLPSSSLLFQLLVSVLLFLGLLDYMQLDSVVFLEAMFPN